MKPTNPTSSSSTPESSLNPSSSLGKGTTEAPRFDTSSVKEMAGDAKRAANNALTQAKEKAATMAEEQKRSAADHIGRYSTALRDSARSVEEEDPNIAYFANQAAERIERVAEYVRQSDFESLRRDVEGVARRNPTLFMGGMFLGGLILGALVKTSAKTMTRGASTSSFDDPDHEPLGALDLGTTPPAVGSY